MSQTTERAFETYAEEILLTKGGWRSGTTAQWDKDRALFPPQVFAFIADTQPKLWAEMRTLHASGLEALLLATLVKELDARGSLHVLRHGFKFYGKTFRLAYFKPAHGANYEVIELFGKNRLTVTRQVTCHPGDNRTVDMVLAIPGGEHVHRHPPARGLQRDRPGPRHWRRVHRAGHEPGLRDWQADQREAAPRTVRLVRLPDSAGGEQVPDRVRPTAAVRQVRGQAAGRRAGGSDFVATEPEDSREGRAIRLGFRQQRRGHLPRL